MISHPQLKQVSILLYIQSYTSTMRNSTELQVFLLLCLLIRLTVSQTVCETNISYNVRCTLITRNTIKYTLEVENCGSPLNYDCAAEQLMICDEACTYCIELIPKSGNKSKLTTTNT